MTANLPSNVVSLRHYPSGDARLLDTIHRAITTGQHLVSNGSDVYVTPIVMPGEFKVGVRIATPKREAA